jgi:hypothetical protein
MAWSWRRDAAWVAAAAAGGFFVLPPIVYATGRQTLGAYADGGLGGFLGNFYTGLGALEAAPWALAVGPAIVVAMWRAMLRVASGFETQGVKS